MPSRRCRAIARPHRRAERGSQYALRSSKGCRLYDAMPHATRQRAGPTNCVGQCERGLRSRETWPVHYNTKRPACVLQAGRPAFNGSSARALPNEGRGLFAKKRWHPLHFVPPRDAAFADAIRARSPACPHKLAPTSTFGKRAGARHAKGAQTPSSATVPLWRLVAAPRFRIDVGCASTQANVEHGPPECPAEASAGGPVLPHRRALGPLRSPHQWNEYRRRRRRHSRKRTEEALPRRSNTLCRARGAMRGR